MVFSQTSHKTQTVLKVVEIDRLKQNKDYQKHGGLAGVITGGNNRTYPSSPVPTTSFSEVRQTPASEYLKPEPVCTSEMYHDSGYEFFQDLVQWCSDPAKEGQVQTIDSNKIIKERADDNNDTLLTQFSPQGWEAFNPNSPNANAGMYCSTPNDPLSPVADDFARFHSSMAPKEYSEVNKEQLFQEGFFDFDNMPVVIRDLELEKAINLNAPSAEYVGWQDIHTNYSTNIQHHSNTQHTMPFIDQEDTLDSKFGSVIPRELETNDVVITEFILGTDRGSRGENREIGAEKRQGLTVTIPTRAPVWSNDINTPDVLSCVEQLEKEKCPLIDMTAPNEWKSEDTGFVSTDACHEMKPSPAPIPEYDPVTPKSESHNESDDDKSYKKSRKRRYADSEESDATYTPYAKETPTRRYNRRNPNIPIQDMIKELEGSQPLKKAKRGRPPKRRESNVSSVCSIDENSSNVSTQEMKYRELRDKNNEASKRSRMNRKLKELQMEQLAMDLEERNNKLKIKADILEDMTKRLKDALMTAILNKD